MLHNIIFQDNIFQLARTIELVNTGLKLELAENLFAEKLLSDVFFCNMVSQKIFTQLEPQAHLHDYLDAMHCLYSCEIKFLSLLTEIIENKIDESPIFAKRLDKLEEIKRIHEDLKNQIASHIRESDLNTESFNIVSETELNELLNF